MSSKGDRTREKILAVALQQLRDHGAARVRMEDVATAAGISRQALYLHFESRTQLMIELLEHLSETVDGAALFRPLEEQTDVSRRLEAGIRASARFIARIHDVALAIDVARHTDDAAAAAWRARAKLRRKSMRRSIALLADAGRLRREWSVDQMTDALCSLTAPRIYADLVRDCGWSQAQFESLLVGLLRTFVTRRAIRR